MSLGARLLLAVIVLDAVLLATVELFFLPLHLPNAYSGADLPLSIALAAVSTPLLVRAAAVIAPRLRVAGAPLGAWLLTILVFGIGGPGGDVVLPSDWRSLLLLAAGVIPCGVVLGRLAATSLTAATAPPLDAPAAAASARPGNP